MKFFSSTEIFNSMFFSVLLGVFFGCIYKSSLCILCAIKKTVLIPFDSFRLSLNLTLNNVKNICNARSCMKIKLIEQFFFEGVIFSLFGLFAILASYVFLDGVLRFYIILTIVIFFIISVKTIGKGFEIMIEKTFGKIYFFELLVFSSIFFPVAKIILFVYNRTVKIIEPMYKNYKIFKSLRIQKKKLSEVSKFI